MKIFHGQLIALMLSAFSMCAIATEHVVDGTSVAAVAINGGTDTGNPGTSCMRVYASVPAVCGGGYIAIPNNNRQLIAAALAAKSTGGPVRLYFLDTAGATYQCPGFASTTCNLVTIELQ